jgi:hypothetical protein
MTPHVGIFWILVFAGVAGCSSTTNFKSTLPKSAKPVPRILVALDKAFADKKVLCFLSHDGRWGARMMTTFSNCIPKERRG